MSLILSRCRLLTTCILLLGSAGILSAQDMGRKAIVTTSKGENIEGLFRSATEQEIVLLIASQPVHVLVPEIRTISFVGRLEESVPNQKIRPIDDAFKAFSELQAVTEIGVVRNQYSAKLIEILPRVQAFIKSEGQSWADVRLLMAQAIKSYQEPLSGDTIASQATAWNNAPDFWASARRTTDYAQKLASEVDEETHREEAVEREIANGTTVEGRLGAGDRLMPREVDRSSEGAFNDVYRLKIDQPTNLVLTLVNSPANCGAGCDLHLTLTDATGKKIDGDMSYSGHSKINKTLQPGVYQVWAGKGYAGHIGRYTLTIGAR